MKIVVFTPALKESAIGRMACIITRELRRLDHEVVVVRSEDESLFGKEVHDFGLPLISWNEHDVVNEIASTADVILYQMGNHYPFHRGCLEWISWLPGVVCLHDFYLGHLFFGWAEKRRAQAEGTLRKWYGESAVENFFKAASSSVFIEETLGVSPMTEWICAMATGVITHSSWDISRARRACAGPVRAVPLAYNVGVVDTGNGALGDDSDHRFLNILTVGHVNTNKRVASVIRAIGSSPLLRDRVVYRLVGSIQSNIVHELAALARNCGVRLRISGEVDEADLAAAFQRADIVCCLRWPSLETASASAIEAMLHGKAIIVTDTGFYRELPDDCVTKVDPMDEAASLRRVLEHLAENDDLRSALGERSRAWATETFTAKNYAEQIIGMVAESSRIRPVLEAIGHLTRVMVSWGGDDARMDQILRSMNLSQFSVGAHKLEHSA